MNKNIFRPFLEKKENIQAELFNNTIGLHKKHYFDYTASGLAFKIIESRIQEVLRTYANTHSKEASMAATTDKYYNDARISLRKSLEIDDSFAILPCGNGATSAIKRFQEILGIYIPPATLKRFKFKTDISDRPLVIVGPYEHHSNEISYREALCDTVRIGLDENGIVDVNHLESILEANSNRQIIGAFCIASNVTGIITPYEKISKLLRKYGAIVCFDAAASSPYMNIKSSLYDAMFLSPHKLLGGPGSCGILLIRKELIDDDVAPTFAGGGTVQYVDRHNHKFVDEKELREDAGTPGILQLIRAALAYQLRNEINFLWIKEQKNKLLRHLINGLMEIKDCTIYGNISEENIGIVSFNIKGVDPYILCAHLSSHDGLQTRAGCSCAGPYGHDFLGLQDNVDLDERPGWVRISVHFSQNISDIDYLLDAIKKAVNLFKN
jgi:selenocysteine lyase/cysteine desulfurase